MKATRGGMRSRSRKPVLVVTRSSPGMPRSMGRAPLATTTSAASNARPSTWTSCALSSRRRAVQGLGAGVAHPALDPLGHRLRERALARDQRRPVDRRPAGEARAVQPARATHGLGRGEQHLLGVAATLPARAAVGETVDDRHSQTFLCAPGRHILGGRPAAYDDDVVLGHRSLLRSPGGGMPVRRGEPRLRRFGRRPIAVQHHSLMCGNHSRSVSDLLRKTS